MVKTLKNRLFRWFKIIALIFVLVFGSHVFSPDYAQALSINNWISSVVSGESLADNDSAFSLPEISDNQPRQTIKIPITAYSSEVGQTDSTPFITASGSMVHCGIVAANFLPIGTRVRFPELFGNEVFVVEDRMNVRYNKRIDIWMEETADAKNFGLQWTTVEVF